MRGCAAHAAREGPRPRPGLSSFQIVRGCADEDDSATGCRHADVNERISWLIYQAGRAGNECTPKDALDIIREWRGPTQLICTDEEAEDILRRFEESA